MPRRLPHLISGLLFLALVAALPRLDGHLTRLETLGAAKVTESYSLPPASLVRALSFGFNELGADLIWVRTIGYYADHLLSDRDVRHLERYLDTILALDDRFAAIYRYGPTMLLTGTGTRDATAVWAAIRLLKRAVRTYPDDWRHAFYLGSYYLTELRGTPKERAAYKREGAGWVHRAALLGADSPWLPNLAAKVYNEQGQRDIAIRHLQELYVTTQDPEMRVQIEGKLKELEARQFLDEARAAAEAFAAARKESGLSFVPPDLFSLLWLPPLRPFALGR
jgi:hypothetical protein